MTPEETERFLKEPHIVDLATVRPDGSPQVTPVWYEYDDGRLLVLADPSSIKVRNIRKDPRVSMSIATHWEPYKYVLVNGTAEISDEWDPELLWTMAVNYKGKLTGKRYAARVEKEATFCLITVTPTRVSGFAE
jgi:PPOX class probable F420-dependent enzyme